MSDEHRPLHHSFIVDLVEPRPPFDEGYCHKALHVRMPVLVDERTDHEFLRGFEEPLVRLAQSRGHCAITVGYDRGEITIVGTTDKGPI